MNDRRWTRSAALLAALSCVAVITEPAAASAQGAPGAYDQGGPPPAGDGWEQGPPPADRYADPYVPPPPAPYQARPGDPPGPYGVSGQQPYAPPYAGPPPYAASGADYAYQQQYGAYQAAQAQWAARNCTGQHAGNTAAGALFGGAAGALLGFSAAGWAARGVWALFGGMIGAAAGAAIGSSASPGDCGGGYAGGPAWAWAGPAYGPGPPPYAPPAYGSGYGTPYRSGWVWAGDRWVRRAPPYGYRRPAPYPAWRY